MERGAAEPGRASPPPTPSAPPATGWRRWRDRLFDSIPGLRTMVRALGNYIQHQSANQAGSIAFSWVLAMFPLLILASSAAGYIGQPGDAANLVAQVMAYAPPLVREALQPVVDQVLKQRNQALLAVGFFGTLWAASSGMQAIRTALNKAYDVQDGLPFWKARIKVTVFTVVVGACTIAVFSSVVVMPHVWNALHAQLNGAENSLWLQDSVRMASAFVVLVVLYVVLYTLLPDIRQSFRTVVPGALLGAALWVVAAMMLSHAFQGARKMVLVYGGFAGVVATLVFIYTSAATLIIGAEVNAVLRASKVEAESKS